MLSSVPFGLEENMSLRFPRALKLLLVVLPISAQTPTIDQLPSIWGEPIPADSPLRGSGDSNR